MPLGPVSLGTFQRSAPRLLPAIEFPALGVADETTYRTSVDHIPILFLVKLPAVQR